MTPTEARDRLTRRHLPHRSSRAIRSGCCRRRWCCRRCAEPIEKRIRVEGVKTGRITALDLPGQIQQALAAGIITETEAAQLRDYDRKVMDIVNVDDFEPHELGTQAQPAPRSSAHVA